MKKILLTILFLSFFNTVFAENKNKEITDFINNMSETSKQILNDKKLSEKEKREKYRNFTDQIIDTKWVARFVLGANWKKINQQQQKEFLELYKEYLLKNYIPKLKDYNNDIKITKITEQKKDTFIVSTKTRDKTNKMINVNFRIIAKNDKFFITDIIPEGISFISNQRTDINSAISKNGYDNFMKSLKIKTEKLK